METTALWSAWCSKQWWCWREQDELCGVLETQMPQQVSQAMDFGAVRPRLGMSCQNNLQLLLDFWHTSSSKPLWYTYYWMYTTALKHIHILRYMYCIYVPLYAQELLKHLSVQGRQHSIRQRPSQVEERYQAWTSKEIQRGSSNSNKSQI